MLPPYLQSIMKKTVILFLFNLILCGHIFAHGDLHGRILKVTKEIKVTPDSAYLYLKRGKLYFQHKFYNKSLSDYALYSKQ